MVQMSRQVIIGASPLYNRGKVQVPAEVRRELNVKDGDRLIWIRNGLSGEIYVRRGDVESVQPKSSPRRFVVR